MSAGEAREQVGRDDRSVPERLVEKRRHIGQNIDESARFEALLAVLRPQVGGDPGCMRGFVEARICESDREALDSSLPALLGHARRDGRRIDASGEEDAERHVGDETPPHSPGEERA